MYVDLIIHTLRAAPSIHITPSISANLINLLFMTILCAKFIILIHKK